MHISSALADNSHRSTLDPSLPELEALDRGLSPRDLAIVRCKKSRNACLSANPPVRRGFERPVGQSITPANIVIRTINSDYPP